MSMHLPSGVSGDGVSLDSLAFQFYERRRSAGVEHNRPAQGAAASGSNYSHAKTPYTPAAQSHLPPTSRRHSGSPLRLTFPGWQQAPNTPSPPPPYASPWQRRDSGTGAVVSPQSLQRARPTSYVFFVGREGASGAGNGGGEEELLSAERSRVFMSGAEARTSGKPAGLGLGMSVGLGEGDEEGGMGLDIGDALGAVYEQMEAQMRKKLEEMRGDIERKARDESKRKIAHLENALSSARAEIVMLKKEKTAMEDEMKEVEERVTAEIKLYAPERPREPELRPLGLCSRVRPPPVPRGASYGHEGRDLPTRPTLGDKKRWSTTSLADIPPRPRTAGLPGVPYRSSTTPLPTLHSNPGPRSSSHAPSSPSRGPRPPSLSLSSSSSSTSPISTPTHSPERTKSFRLSQRFTSLSHNSVNAQAYEDLVARGPQSVDPSMGRFQAESLPAVTRKRRPQSVHAWAPSRGLDVTPEPHTDAGSGAGPGAGDCPVAAAYRKLVGEDGPVRLESLPETEVEPGLEKLRGLSAVYSLSRERELPRQHVARHEGEINEERRESVKMGRRSVRISWARVNGQPGTKIAELPAGEASLLSGYRAVRGHITPSPHETTFPEDLFPTSLAAVASTAAPPAWAEEPYRELQVALRHPASKMQLQHVPRTRQITGVLGTLAQCSGWATVFGFAGLTVGGWCMRIEF